MRRLKIVVALSLGGFAYLCFGQTQRPQQPWTRITASGDVNTNEISFVRTRDSRLHVAWKHQRTPSESDLMHTVIDANGVVKEPKPMLQGWSALTVPALIVDDDGTLRAIFSGIQNPKIASPYNQGSLYSLSNNYAGSWKLLQGQLSASTNAYSAGTIAAARGGNGTVAAWSGSVQTRLSPSAQPVQLQSGCCAYLPGLAVDSTGEVVVAWYSNATPEQGLFAQTVSPSLGTKTLVPGSVTTYGGSRSSIAPDQQTPISGRMGAPGVFIAFCEGYPTATKVDLWQYGRSQPMAVASVRSGCHVHVSAGPEGRLWVVWSDQGSIYAVRSNRNVTRFSAPIAIEPPEKWSVTYRIKGEGSAGPLDVFAHMATASGVSTWHTHVFPRLSVSTIPSTDRSAAMIEVSDVGDPVAGATIKVDGQTVATDGRGRAAIALQKGVAVSANVNAAGYAPATVTLGAAQN